MGQAAGVEVLRCSRLLFVHVTGRDANREQQPIPFDYALRRADTASSGTSIRGGLVG